MLLFVDHFVFTTSAWTACCHGKLYEKVTMVEARSAKYLAHFGPPLFLRPNSDRIQASPARLLVWASAPC
jgi:hypothetical protein